jgi:glycine hydroxymethyltransferase|tara:strand:- start:1522 stop:2742 length:1221 start_codon:yes stop_codon:yes gene_type:complete
MSVKDILNLLDKERTHQEETINMIASENYPNPDILRACSSIISNKYSEGYPGKRYYSGTKFVDEIEQKAIDLAKRLFNAEHANVQPHSGTNANMAVLFAVLKEGDTILSMDMSCGGHISHGNNFSFSGKFFNIVSYNTDKSTGLIDYDQVKELASKYKPKMIIAGASSYPRNIDFKKFKEIADEINAYLLCDIAHTAGFVCTGLHQNPTPFADFVTFTTHKSLNGPRGGVILCKEEHTKKIDRSIFPGIQGGPINNIIAAKAICFEYALKEEFKDHMQKVLDNSKLLCKLLKQKEFNLVSDGSDNHMILIDLSNKDINGAYAQIALEKAGILVNKNLIPFDKATAFEPSGIRLGSLGITTRNFSEEDIIKVIDIFSIVLNNSNDEDLLHTKNEEVKSICKKYPLKC